MASPFRIFRKHVKLLLAVFTVLLMLSWVVGDSLRSYIGSDSANGGGRGTRAPDAVAVRWEGGELTNRDLGHLVARRGLVNAFLGQVEFLGQQKSFEAGVEPQPLRVERIRGPERPSEGVERHVVYTKLVADMARKAGMRISDDAIAHYLDELGRGRVTREEMRNIIQRLQALGGRATTAYIFDALRDELLARNYLASYQFSLATVTPEERWQDWLRSNDRIVLEAVAFPAENFLVDVPEPTDAQLTAFVQGTDGNGNKYNYLERDPQPDNVGGMELPSPHPGFAIPREIDVQYIEANYDKALTKMENEITDEEISKFYEEHKDPLFLKLNTRLIDEAKKPGEPAESKPNDEGAAAAAEAADETKQPSAPPHDTPQQPPADSGGSAPAPDGKSSAAPSATKSQFRLVAFQQDAGKADATETPPASTTSDAAPDASPDAPVEAKNEVATSGEADASAEGAAAKSPVAAEKPKEFQPLEDVRDDIRRQLASERVAEQLISLMKDLYQEVNGEFEKYFSESLTARVDEKGPPPATGLLADLKPLAEKHGLEFGATGPLSYLEMRKTPVGESNDPESRLTLAQLLFGSKEVELYQPKLTVDILGNRYLSMKTSDTPRKIPTLAEVRDEVARAWRLNEASKLALKHAEEVAQKAGESGSSLADYFADDKSTQVIHTDPFSWLTGGEVSRFTGQPQPLRLSEPDGIAAAGPEFMKYVFGLEEGKTGATLNHDNSVAYVVRVAEHQLSPEALRAAYLAEANTWPALGSMIGGHMQANSSRMLADITARANIKWERDPDAVVAEE